jgi:phosphonate transport system ATP-binding protein
MIEFKSANLIFDNGFHALKDIDLSVGPGELIAVIGRSGAGKSTLLRTLNGTLPISSGTAKVLECSLSNSPSQKDLRILRSKIGFIFQQFNLVKNLTALENVIHGRLSQIGLIPSLFSLWPEADLHRAESALNAVGLNEKHRARVDQLSGGQQQRVAIARALVQEPQIILADEPMASLDPKLSRVVLELLSSFQKERGMTVLVNMHVLEHVREFAQRVIGMREGKIVFDGPVSALDQAAVARIYDGAQS